MTSVRLHGINGQILHLAQEYTYTNGVLQHIPGECVRVIRQVAVCVKANDIERYAYSRTAAIAVANCDPQYVDICTYPHRVVFVRLNGVVVKEITNSQDETKKSLVSHCVPQRCKNCTKHRFVMIYVKNTKIAHQSFELLKTVHLRWTNK